MGNSSNPRRLVSAEKSSPAAYLVNDVSSVDLRWIAGVRRSEISARASAPRHLVDQLMGCLADLGPTTVSEIDVINENTHVALPKQVA
jgi:4-hydroxy-3-methylbut-2-en-1-yl diphosphate reductase